MILDPINSITSINFYKKVSEQKLGRTFLYIAFLGLFFSAAFAVTVKVRLWPAIENTFSWLETAVPTLTYSKGRITTPTNEALTVRHPTIPQVAFAIDPNRTAPATAVELSDGKLIGLLTGGAMYILDGNKVTAYDFSRSASDKTVIIDAKFYRELARGLKIALYPLALIVCFVFFCVWKLAAALFFSLVAVMLGSMQEPRLPYKSLFNISAYAQTLVIAVQGMLLIIPAHVPLFRPLAFAATTIYIWLAIRKHAPPQPQEQP
jgi:hypothetical protein